MEKAFEIIPKAIEAAGKYHKDISEAIGNHIDNIGKAKDLIFDTLDKRQENINNTRDLRIKEIADSGIILNDEMRDKLEQEYTNIISKYKNMSEESLKFGNSSKQNECNSSESGVFAEIIMFFVFSFFLVLSWLGLFKLLRFQYIFRQLHGQNGKIFLQHNSLQTLSE